MGLFIWLSEGIIYVWNLSKAGIMYLVVFIKCIGFKFVVFDLTDVVYLIIYGFDLCLEFEHWKNNKLN